MCNAPSELCDKSYWNIITESNYSLSSWTGSSVCDLKIDDDIILVMNGKQWVNIDESLRIHYMINIENITNNSGSGDTGILINYVNFCEYYYVGISVTNNGYKLFISEMKDSIYTELISKPISILSNKIYYQLSIDVEYNPNNITFIVSINNFSITYFDITPINYMILSSGYIGIKNNALIINAKSLFISGCKIYINDDGIDTEFGKCTTASPTFEPTIDTPAPTLSPTTEFCGNNIYCISIFEDIYPPSNGTYTYDIIIQQKDQNAFVYFNIFITSKINQCIQPTITFNYEEIDYDSSTEYINLYDENNNFIIKCNSGTQYNCGSFDNCINQYQILNQQQKLPINKTKLILGLELSDNVDELCTSITGKNLAMNAILTIQCNNDQSVIPTIYPTNEPTVHT